MKLIVNGESISVDSQSNTIILNALIEQLNYEPRLVVVELNGEIISPRLWQNETIKDGDSLEIVTIVGGGS